MSTKQLKTLLLFFLLVLFMLSAFGCTSVKCPGAHPYGKSKPQPYTKAEKPWVR